MPTDLVESKTETLAKSLTEMLTGPFTELRTDLLTLFLTDCPMLAFIIYFIGSQDRNRTCNQGISPIWGQCLPRVCHFAT
jgi:hypothetical protein